MTYAQQKGIASYGRMAHSDTDPVRQIVMLYDGAIRFLNLTAADIDAGDLMGKAEHSSRALDIIGYLQATLDFEKGGVVAVRLDQFYRQLIAIVLRGSARQDADAMRNAAKLIEPVRNAWQVNAKPVITLNAA